MLDTLARIYDYGGQLLGVTHARFESDPQFITAVGLRFESLTAVFRAVADDDTLAANVGELSPGSHEVLADTSHEAPWADCVGHSVSWAWRMTNHQGYTDGVRFEFGLPDEAASVIAELVVVASTIRLFVSREARPT